jgi:hypothetical protein
VSENYTEMFEIETSDPARLWRIVAAGTGGLLIGFALVAFNLVGPLVTGGGYGTTNLLFGAFGVLAVVLATHPTYHAARELDES